MKLIGIGSLALFIGTVFAANWAVETYGPVPVGFGLMAPAGVYFAGLAFTFRDLIQRTLGKWAVVLGIAFGAAASWFVSEDLAKASALAFLASELADFVVYTVTQRWTFIGAVAASNMVGITVDSIVFLWMAFGSFAFLEGQIVGKAWMTLAALPLLFVARWRLPVGAPSSKR